MGRWSCRPGPYARSPPSRRTASQPSRFVVVPLIKAPLFPLSYSTREWFLQQQVPTPRSVVGAGGVGFVLGKERIFLSAPVHISRDLLVSFATATATATAQNRIPSPQPNACARAALTPYLGTVRGSYTTGESRPLSRPCRRAASACLRSQSGERPRPCQWPTRPSQGHSSAIGRRRPQAYISFFLLSESSKGVL
jgi:hypothetical protein